MALLFGNDAMQRPGMWGGMSPVAQPYPQGGSQTFTGLPAMANTPLAGNAPNAMAGGPPTNNVRRAREGQPQWMNALPLDDSNRRRPLGLNIPALLGPLASLKPPQPAALERTPGIVSTPGRDTSLAVKPIEQQPLSEVATNRNSLGERNVNTSPTWDHGGVSRPAPGPASEEAGKRPLAITPKLADQYGEVQSSLSTLTAQKPQEPKMNFGKKALGTLLELSTNPNVSNLGYRWIHPAAIERERQKGVLEERAKGIQAQASIEDVESQAQERIAKANQPPKPERAESVDQEIADAAVQAQREGRDPNTDPKVLQLLDVKQRGQKDPTPKIPNDFDQFYASWLKDNKQTDTAANRLKARKEWSAADAKPEKPQRTLVTVPQPDGSAKVIEAEPGSVIPKGARTVQEFGKEQAPTADEQRRADLAKNLTENLDRLEEIVKRRPDLFGPAAGRYTSLRQVVGTGDPDVAALANIKEQTGLAMVGTHAMRNAQHAEKAADSIINAFKNKPEALLGPKGSIASARNSLQTFIGDVQGQRVQDAQPQGGAGPKVGDVENGYRFKGGNPGDKKNWEKVK